MIINCDELIRLVAQYATREQSEGERIQSLTITFGESTVMKTDRFETTDGRRITVGLDEAGLAVSLEITG